jgi:hypothetical protein
MVQAIRICAINIGLAASSKEVSHYVDWAIALIGYSDGER